MARATMLLLVVELVVCNPKIQTEDVLKERSESNIEVVGHEIEVVLDIRLDDLLLGLIVTHKIVCKPWEVLLKVVLLHIHVA